MTRRNRIAATIAGAVALGACLWLWLSPALTLSAMRDAARSGDMATIDAHIDYPALRSNLRAQMEEKIRSQLGGVNAELAMALASGGIDALVTPEAMRATIAGGSTVGASAAPGEGMLRDGGVEITRTGITSFLAGTPNPGGTPGGAVFSLQGLTWRITGIQVPGPAKPYVPAHHTGEERP